MATTRAVWKEELKEVRTTHLLYGGFLHTIASKQEGSGVVGVLGLRKDPKSLDKQYAN